MRKRGIELSPGVLTFLVGLFLLAVTGLVYQRSLVGPGSGGAPAAGSSAAGDSVAATQSGGTVATATPEYTCPMHPQIVQDHPGSCPICGMELVPKRTDSAAADPKLTKAVETVKLSPTQAVQGNVDTIMPTREKMALTLPAIGEVQAPQDKMRMLTAWQEGRVDNLILRENGGVIKAGEHIMDVYSPDLIQAQGEYLIAFKATEQLGQVPYESAAKGSKRMLEAARQKLTRLGMTEKQVTTLEETRKVQDHVAIYAKYGGTVMEKKVQEGMSVMPGEELFSVADLHQVWVEVQVFEKDAASIKIGQSVSLTSPAYPQRVFHGKVLLIEPELDMTNKTFKARVGVANPGGLLKPGQVLDAQVTVDYGTPLLLPRNAVLHTGTGDLVYVTAGDGLWEPRKVVVGRDFGDKVEIVSGLTAQEGVAGTAVFLLDSEAQLKGVPRP